MEIGVGVVSTISVSRMDREIMNDRVRDYGWREIVPHSPGIPMRRSRRENEVCGIETAKAEKQNVTNSPADSLKPSVTSDFRKASKPASLVTRTPRNSIFTERPNPTPIASLRPSVDPLFWKYGDAAVQPMIQLVRLGDNSRW